MTTEEKIEYVDFLFHKSGKAYENRYQIFELLFELLDEGASIAAEWLSEAYETEQVAEPDYEASDGFLLLSKDMNNPEGLYYWAIDTHYSASEEYRLNLLERSVKGDYYPACYALAMRIIKDNPDRGIGLLKKAADHDIEEAMVKYAIATYAYDKDCKDVFNYLEKAERDDNFKRYCLLFGFFYENGIGVEKDIAKACEYYHNDHNFFTSHNSRGLLAVQVLKGHKCFDISIEEAVQYLKEAARYSYVPDSVFAMLSICYEKGIGTDIDLKDANKNKKKAIEANKKMKDYQFLVLLLQ